jgi:hypothetical protein
VVFTLTNVTSGTLSNIQVRFATGKPHGHNHVESGLVLTPKLVSISPSSGTVGGTTLTMNIQGVGVDSTNIAIQDANGASICDVVTISAYSQVSCVTKK